MSKMKIIPAIDLMEGMVVRLYKGDPSKKTTYSDNPIEIAKKWERAGADMLHLVDLDAALERGSNFDLMQNIAKSVNITVEVAGGLRNQSLIENALCFAQRVVVGTLAYKDKAMLAKLLRMYGNDRIVISVDHNDGLIAVNGWQQTIKLSLIDAVNEFMKMGFSEFLSTSIDRDGTLQGPDLKWIRQINKIKNLNVIASGGISSINDVNKVKEIDPFGVILGKALYENKISIEEAKKLV